MLHSTIRKGTAVAVTLATLFAAQAGAAEDAVKLPASMVWTSYDVGSAGYVEASAMADALDKTFGTRIRITPSGTAIGRMLPMSKGRATFGFMGNEVNFATEAMFEFAARDWGPQDMRVVLGRPASVGLVTGGDTDIDSVADLKGKKVGFVQASPSTTLNTETVLAFAGLTHADVQEVLYPSYSAMLNGFVAGEVDAAPAVPTSATLREAEGGRGVRWLDMPASDTEGWERVHKFSSLFAPYEATVGVSISDSDPAELLGYRYPLLSVYANADEDEVYNMIKALDQAFDMYKGASKEIGFWKVDLAGKTPSSAPFHPGAVRYLKEIGVWTDKDEAWNEARLARLEAVKAAWTEALAKAKEANVSDQDWPAFWADYKAQTLK